MPKNACEFGVYLLGNNYHPIGACMLNKIQCNNFTKRCVMSVFLRRGEKSFFRWKKNALLKTKKSIIRSDNESDQEKKIGQ